MSRSELLVRLLLFVAAPLAIGARLNGFWVTVASWIVVCGAFRLVGRFHSRNQGET